MLASFGRAGDSQVRISCPAGVGGALDTTVCGDTSCCLHVLEGLCSCCRDSCLQCFLSSSSLAFSSEAPCDCQGEPGAVGFLQEGMSFVPSLCSGPGGLLVLDLAGCWRLVSGWGGVQSGRGQGASLRHSGRFLRPLSKGLHVAGTCDKLLEKLTRQEQSHVMSKGDPRSDGMPAPDLPCWD